jgi:signal transduction histidine kinase
MALERPELLNEVSETIGTGIDELRALSKLINPEALKSLSLQEAVSLEIERFNRLKFIAAELKVQGNVRPIESNTQIILFRILQEFFSNTIKHSRASTLKVVLNYSDEILTISAEDNGVGFDKTDNFMGIGLKNMKTRAQLINSTLKINSVKDHGTALHLKYNYL